MNTTLYFNLNLFDGVHNRIFKDAWLLVNDQTGKIIKTGPSSKLPAVANVVNLHQKYVMPGMINCHTHVSMEPSSSTGDGNAGVIVSTLRAVKHLHELLKSGVTYVRGCGCNHEMIDTTLNQLQQSGQLTKVPEMMPAGQPMTMTGGHGTLFGGGHVVDSTDEMRKAVRKNFADGAECTKVMATGGVMSKADNMTQPQLTVPEMKVAVYETHAKHSIVAAHAEANPGIKNALLAGVDSIEHGFYLTDQEIQMMVKHHVYLTPTLVSGWGIMHCPGIPEWERQKSISCTQHGNQSFKKAYQAGVKFTLGTDAGCPYSFFDDTPKEFELLVKEVGFSNFDALMTSKHSAELMKLNDYGSLEPNKYADFLVLNHDPLKDVKAVQQVDKSVYKKGVKEY